LAIKNEAEANRLVADLKASRFTVSELETKEVKRNPLPPFTTSTLQQEAAKRLGYSAKRTMLLAQHLYEAGRITYMRTDSVTLSREALTQAKSWLTTNFGSEYAAQAPRTFTAKSKLVQEAHEAIRPTDVALTPDQIALTDEGEKKIYRLIWQRFLASQMPQARIAATLLEIEGQKSGSPTYILKATGQRVVFEGYLKVWPQKLVEKELPALQKGDALDLKNITPSQHFTEPPPRFSEASLIKTLEEYGIGRPSTYAPIISVIQVRNYVLKEQGRFWPTEIGELVNQVLVENFPEVVDVQFTAKMEESLDAVAAGFEKWEELIGSFYEPFAKNLKVKYAEVEKQNPVATPTNEVCEKCGKPMVIKFGRFGKFLACSGFPECKNTKPLHGEGGAKEGPKPIGMKCSKCSEGEIVERRVSRGRARGKIFWGCSRYPKCDYASWTNPKEPVPPDPKKEE